MKNLCKQLVIASFSSILLGCAGQDSADPGPPEETVSSRSDCISKGSIRDYKVLDDANLIVSERSSRRYHVTLSRKVFGLRSMVGIGFDSTNSRICGGFDSLIVNDTFGPEKVRIATVRRLTPEQEEDLLVRFGLREPAVEQPRQPEEVEGAEVEELD